MVCFFSHGKSIYYRKGDDWESNITDFREQVKCRISDLNYNNLNKPSWTKKISESRIKMLAVCLIKIKPKGTLTKHT